MKVFVGLLATIFLLTSCGNKKEVERLTSEIAHLKEENEELKASLQTARTASDRLAFLSKKLKGVKARIVTNYGNIEVEFFNEKAPITILTFISHAEGGYYDDTQFHRVIKGYLIQGGDPNSKDDAPYNDGLGGPITAIPHEFNDIKHEPGILSVARVAALGAGAGSQFFILHGAAPQLDNQYTVFGKVTKGMDVVDKIANVKTNQGDRRLREHPINPVIIKTIEVFR
jgi:peptidyl-prolyl cis-trans isomerase B (cyclophilin B)